ncbi:MAG: hypothetical protein D4R74_04420 [Betaproteobacteria bacterium]|nr:MAG: hypothetical protein D4R74_04420 [Betaproteobacteria bacterium]
MNCRRVRTDHRLLCDVDAVESNEAFAAQACVVAKDLNCEPVKNIPNGGAVSPGRSIGATALARGPVGIRAREARRLANRNGDAPEFQLQQKRSRPVILVPYHFADWVCTDQVRKSQLDMESCKCR